MITDWNRSLGELKFKNGSLAKIYSGDTPERLRGPQFHWAWIDELAACRYLASPGANNLWDTLMLALRLGKAQCMVATTPKPIPKLRAILDSPHTVTTRGTTYENLANLGASFAEFIEQYEGTSLAQQELLGELLEDMPGALWSNALIDRYRVNQAPELKRIVIAVDPSLSDGEGADEAGIIVAGEGVDGDGYILHDASGKMMPSAWGRRTRDLYESWDADVIVAEKNQGGEMVRDTINGAGGKLPISLIHASRGKQARAEPIQMLYEQGRIHHIGSMPMLEAQMCTWQPHVDGKSPDRVDAMVYALSKLLVRRRRPVVVGPLFIPKDDHQSGYERR